MPDTDHNSNVSKIFADYVGVDEGLDEQENKAPAKKGDSDDSSKKTAAKKKS